MTPVFTGLTILFLVIAVLSNNVGLAAIGLVCAFSGV
jgi:hypothetical protein